jgi:hypothetical protein
MVKIAAVAIISPAILTTKSTKSIIIIIIIAVVINIKHLV